MSIFTNHLDAIHMKYRSGIMGLDLVINGQLFFVIQILDVLHIHRWFNIPNIVPHLPDDGLLEPKRYSVDFASQYIYIYIYTITFRVYW